MDARLKAQLRTSLDRSSKVIKDHGRIEAVVEVRGAGRLVLRVDGGGGYSLRGYAEGDEASSSCQNLIAVGVISPEGVVSLRPESAASGAEFG